MKHLANLTWNNLTQPIPTIARVIYQEFAVLKFGWKVRMKTPSDENSVGWKIRRMINPSDEKSTLNKFYFINPAFLIHFGTYRKTRKMRNRRGIPQDIKNSSFNEYSLGHTLSASSKTLRNVDRICVQQLSKNSSVDDSRKVTNT